MTEFAFTLADPLRLPAAGGVAEASVITCRAPADRHGKICFHIRRHVGRVLNRIPDARTQDERDADRAEINDDDDITAEELRDVLFLSEVDSGAVMRAFVGLITKRGVATIEGRDLKPSHVRMMSVPDLERLVVEYLARFPAVLAPDPETGPETADHRVYPGDC